MYTFERDERSTFSWVKLPAAAVKGLPVTAVHGPLVELPYSTFKLPLDGRYQNVNRFGVVRIGVIR